MEAIHTANGMFNYNDKFYDIDLDTWVQETHKYNCEKNNWKYSYLKKGAFGYDNLAVSIGFTLRKYEHNYDEESSLYKLAELIHDGWSINYIYWKEKHPENSKTYKYIAPFNPLEDERRNTCAITQFRWLDDEEKNKDYIIAEFLYRKITQIKMYMSDSKSENKINNECIL